MSHFTPKKPGAYTGALVYQQEQGYTMITLMVRVLPGETSQVITHAYNLLIVEDAEHLGGIDVYHFAASSGTRIQLIISSPEGEVEAWYTVSANTVLGIASPLNLDIVRSSDSIPLAIQN